MYRVWGLVSFFCLLGLAPVAQAAVYNLNVQPVSICIRTATVPSCSAVDINTQFLNDIWAPADIGISVYEPTQSEAFILDVDSSGAISGFDLYSQFFTWQSLQGLASNTIYVGVADKFQGNILGLAAIGFPYVVVQGEGMTTDAVTYTIAHEMGHALGADHYEVPENAASISQYLMEESVLVSSISSSSLPALSPQTLDAISQSSLLAASNQPLAAPIPFGGVLLLSALGLLGLMRGRGQMLRKTQALPA